MVGVLTGLIIQAQNVSVDTFQNNVSRKWGYEILFFDRGNPCPLLTSLPMYASKIIAEETGYSLVRWIRRIDFTKRVKLN